MKIKLFGTFRDIAKASEIEMESPDLPALLNDLVAKYGREFANELLKDGRLKETVLFIVNGRLIKPFQVDGTRLKQEDYITIMPMTAGG
jgi:MoaD family protein